MSKSFKEIMDSVWRMRKKRMRYIPELEPIKLIKRTAIETHNFVRIPYKPERIRTALGTRKGLNTGMSFNSNYEKQKGFTRSAKRNTNTSLCSIK